MSEERDFFAQAWRDRMPHAAIWGEAVPYTQARIGRQHVSVAMQVTYRKPRIDWGAVALWCAGVGFCVAVWLVVIWLFWKTATNG